jgi:hypothetical protein
MFRTAHRAISKSAVHTDPSWQSSIPREIEVICQEENDFDSVLMAPYGGVGQSVERQEMRMGCKWTPGFHFGLDSAALPQVAFCTSVLFTPVHAQRYFVQKLIPTRITIPFH